MERKITFVNSRTQSQKVLENSTATTLGELKAEMRQAGIEYDGMTFYEGHARIELKDDASVLPTNVTYKGTVVNDLVFMLTTPNKKVASGSMTRAEAYAAIKERGLQDVCKNTYGKNFTQCSTTALIELIATHETEVEVPAAVVEPVICTPAECTCEPVKNALKVLVEALYDDDIIGNRTRNDVYEALEGAKPVADKMSSREIREMFDFIEG
jgi:hypothetical protein